MSRRVLPALAAVLLAGCGGNGLVPLTGRVTLDGAPVGGTTLTFLPESGDGTPGFALTGPGGEFEARSGDDPGVRPGRYKVVAVKDVPLESGEAGPAPGAGGEIRSSPRTPRRSLLPTAYADGAGTPLRCEVPAGGLRGHEVRLVVRP